MQLELLDEVATEGIEIEAESLVNVDQFWRDATLNYPNDVHNRVTIRAFLPHSARAFVRVCPKSPTRSTAMKGIKIVRILPEVVGAVTVCLFLLIAFLDRAGEDSFAVTSER